MLSISRSSNYTSLERNSNLLVEEKKKPILDKKELQKKGNIDLNISYKNSIPQTTHNSPYFSQSSFNNFYGKIILVQKPAADGSLITIYADENDKVKAKIDKNGMTTDAFFIKRIVSTINIKDQGSVQWLRYTLENDCYFKVSQGNVYINSKILGGMENSEEDENVSSFLKDADETNETIKTQKKRESQEKNYYETKSVIPNDNTATTEKNSVSSSQNNNLISPSSISSTIMSFESKAAVFRQLTYDDQKELLKSLGTRFTNYIVKYEKERCVELLIWAIQNPDNNRRFFKFLLKIVIEIIDGYEELLGKVLLVAVHNDSTDALKFLLSNFTFFSGKFSSYYLNLALQNASYKDLPTIFSLLLNNIPSNKFSCFYYNQAWDRARTKGWEVVSTGPEI